MTQVEGPITECLQSSHLKGSMSIELACSELIVCYTGQVHVGFPKVGMVQTRATCDMVVPMDLNVSLFWMSNINNCILDRFVPKKMSQNLVLI